MFTEFSDNRDVRTLLPHKRRRLMDDSFESIYTINANTSNCADSNNNHYEQSHSNDAANVTMDELVYALQHYYHHNGQEQHVHGADFSHDQSAQSMYDQSHIQNEPQYPPAPHRDNQQEEAFQRQLQDMLAKFPPLLDVIFILHHDTDTASILNELFSVFGSGSTALTKPTAPSPLPLANQFANCTTNGLAACNAKRARVVPCNMDNHQHHRHHRNHNHNGNRHQCSLPTASLHTTQSVSSSDYSITVPLVSSDIAPPAPPKIEPKWQAPPPRPLRPSPPAKPTPPSIPILGGTNRKAAVPAPVSTSTSAAKAPSTTTSNATSSTKSKLKAHVARMESVSTLAENERGTRAYGEHTYAYSIPRPILTRVKQKEISLIRKRVDLRVQKIVDTIARVIEQSDHARTRIHASFSIDADFQRDITQQIAVKLEKWNGGKYRSKVHDEKTCFSKTRTYWNRQKAQELGDKLFGPVLCQLFQFVMAKYQTDDDYLKIMLFLDVYLALCRQTIQFDRSMARPLVLNACYYKPNKWKMSGEHFFKCFSTDLSFYNVKCTKTVKCDGKTRSVYIRDDKRSKQLHDDFENILKTIQSRLSRHPIDYAFIRKGIVLYDLWIQDAGKSPPVPSGSLITPN